MVTDLIVATGRQIRALRNLGGAGEQAADHRSSKPEAEKGDRGDREERPTLQRRRTAEGPSRGVLSAPWHTAAKVKA